MLIERSDSGDFIILRRHVVAILGFLCSILMHAQRLNIGVAMVAMINNTGLQTEQRGSNTTECLNMEVFNNNSLTVRDGEFLWSPELQGYILSAGFLGYVLTQILGGILAGKYGTKPILLSGLLCASICNLLSPVFARQHPYLLLSVQLIRGMGQGLQQPSMSVLMSKWFPRCERGFLSAFIYCGYPVGALISGLVSGILCDLDFMDGWPMVFYFFGILGLLVAVILILFFAESPEVDPRISQEELKHILSLQERSAILKPVTPWKAILLSTTTYVLIIALFGQYWMAFYFLSVHPTFMGTILHIPIKQNGILSSGPYVLQTLAGWCVCWLSLLLTRTKRAQVDSLRKGCNSLSCSVFALGLLGIYFAGCDTLWSEVSLFIAMGSVGFGFAGSLITAVDMSPTFCGPLMGFASTVGSLAGFIIPVIVGTLTNNEQTMTQWRLVFVISAVVGAGSGLIFQTLGSANIQPWEPASKNHMNCKQKQISKLKNFAIN